MVAEKKKYVLYKCLDCGLYQAIAMSCCKMSCLECGGNLQSLGQFYKKTISDMFQNGEIPQEEMWYFG